MEAGNRERGSQVKQDILKNFQSMQTVVSLLGRLLKQQYVSQHAPSLIIILEQSIHKYLAKN